MFTCLEARSRASRKSIGFEVTVDKEQALTWLRQNRCDVFRTLNLGDYDLAKCGACGRIADHDTMKKTDKKGETRCDSCSSR